MTLEPLHRADMTDVRQKFGVPFYTIHRVNLHNELLHLTSGLDLQLGAKVLAAYPAFRNYEMFSPNMIKKKVWQAVLQKYLLNGSHMADDMLCRIYMGKQAAETSYPLFMPR